MTIVRAALVQARWTGDKDSMIAHHEQQARLAAAEGARNRKCRAGRTTSISGRLPIRAS